MSQALDIAASPTLSTLVRAIGEEATARLVARRGGTDVYLPARITEDCALAQAVGLEAARAIVAAFGANRHLVIPTGKGLAHGRRISRRQVMELHAAGQSADAIAQAMGCTSRQIWNILRAAREEDPRQPRLF